MVPTNPKTTIDRLLLRNNCPIIVSVGKKFGVMNELNQS